MFSIQLEGSHSTIVLNAQIAEDLLEEEPAQLELAAINSSKVDQSEAALTTTSLFVYDVISMRSCIKLAFRTL